MAVKFTIDDESLKDAAERLQALGDAGNVEAAALAEAAVLALEKTGEEMRRFAATMAATTKGKTLGDLLSASIPKRLLEEWAETARQAAAQAHKYNQNMRLSAVFAVEQVWRLLAEISAKDDVTPPFSESVAIQWALETERDKDDAIAGELLESSRWGPDSRKGRFVAQLQEHVSAMRDAVGMGDGLDLPETEEAAARRADVDGEPLLWLDEGFARYLEGVGETGEALADDVRNKARARWAKQRQLTTEGEPENGRLLALWIDLAADTDSYRSAGLFPFLQRLALAAWRDVLRPELEREREAEWRVGAINVGPFDDALVPLMSPRAVAKASAKDGRQLVLLFDATGHEVGYFEGWVLDDITTTALERLRSPPFIRLASIGANVVAQQQAMGARNPLITELPGRTELARELGLRSVGELDALFDAAQKYQGEGIDPSGRRWFIRGLFNVFGTEAPAPGQPSRTLLQWSPGLFIGQGWKTPMPDANEPWPLLGSKARGKGMFAHVLIHRQLAERSLEIAKEGHAPLAWGEIAAAAALGRRPMSNLRKLELEGQGESGPWLIEEVPGRYRLADEKRHDFLVRQGQLRGYRQEGGRVRAAVAKREAGKFAKKRGYKGRNRKD